MKTTCKRYDLIFGLGTACSCSQSLRAAGLQLLTFPYDWTAPILPNDLRVRADFIADGFTAWFEKEDLEPYEASADAIRRATDANGRVRALYRNRRTQHSFPHEFWSDESLDAAYPAAAEKYRRRIARLGDCLMSAKNVLVVRLDTPIQPGPTSAEDCEYALDRLARRFPGVRFEMLHLVCQKGLPFDALRDEQTSPRIRTVSWDYRDLTPGVPAYSVRLDQTGQWLRENYRVRDYRTRAERKAQHRRELQAKYRANGASNALQYRLIKIRKQLLKLCGKR